MSRRMRISIAQQRLELWQGEELIYNTKISSGKAGVGSEYNSGKTPLGQFCIYSKHGENAPEQCYFTARIPQGLWENHKQGMKEGILSRILCLQGLDEHNSNTRDRYIYIHGTSDVAQLGQPASFGCIRLAPQAMIKLYSLCPLGMKLVIEA